MKVVLRLVLQIGPGSEQRIGEAVRGVDVDDGAPLLEGLALPLADEADLGADAPVGLQVAAVLPLLDVSGLGDDRPHRFPRCLDMDAGSGDTHSCESNPSGPKTARPSPSAQPSMATVQNPYFLGAAVSRSTRPVTFPDYLPSPIRGTCGGCGRLQSSAPRCRSDHAVVVRALNSGRRRAARAADRRSAASRCQRLRAPLSRAAAWCCIWHALCSPPLPPASRRDTAACRPARALARRLFALCRS